MLSVIDLSTVAGLLLTSVQHYDSVMTRNDDRDCPETAIGLSQQSTQNASIVTFCVLLL